MKKEKKKERSRIEMYFRQEAMSMMWTGSLSISDNLETCVLQNEAIGPL